MIRIPSTVSQKIRGFTLLEITIVLVLISLVAGGALVMLTASVQQAAYNGTVDTMQAIDDALLKFRLANNRLPCPGDLTIPPGSAGYGMEAGTLTPGITSATSPSSGVGTGNCYGTISVNIAGTPTSETVTPSASFYSTQNTPYVIEGSVPTRALRLPDSYMFDAWGNHIRYIVSSGVTAANAFTTMPFVSLTSSGKIQFFDGNGGTRTLSAVYALLSHGANGFGAYTQNGTLSALTSGNTNELWNSHYNLRAVSGSAVNFSSYEWFQELPQYQSGYLGNSNYYFDDIATFKERWQLQSPQDSNPPPAAGNGLGLVAVGGNGTNGYIYPYVQNGSTFTCASYTCLTSLSYNPSTEPTMSAINGVAFSSDNQLMAISGTPIGSNSGMTVYTVSGGIIAYPPSYNASTPTSTTIQNVAFLNYNDSFFATYINSGLPYYISYTPAIYVPFTTPYYNSNFLIGFGYPGSQVAMAVAPQAATYIVAFVFTYGGSTKFQITYNSTLTSIPNISAVNGASFSKDNLYLAIATATTSSVAEVLVYSTAGFNAQLASTLVVGGSAATGVAFSHSGNTLAVTSNGYPYLYFFTNNRNGTFTAYSPISIAAGPNAKAVGWSRDDQFVAVGNGASDTGDGSTCGTNYGWCGLALYQVLGTTVNPLPAVANPPKMNISGVAFTN